MANIRDKYREKSLNYDCRIMIAVSHLTNPQKLEILHCIKRLAYENAKQKRARQYRFDGVLRVMEASSAIRPKNH